MVWEGTTAQETKIIYGETLSCPNSRTSETLFLRAQESKVLIFKQAKYYFSKATKKTDC